MPGAVDVDSSLIVGKPEIGVYIDRARAADLGVQPSDIATALRLLVEGDQVSTYEEHGEEYDVHVRAERAVPRRRAGAAPADRALVAPRLRLARGRRAPERRHRAVAHRPPEPRSAGARSSPTPAPGYSDGAISDGADEHHQGPCTCRPGTPPSRPVRRKEMGRAVRRASCSSLVLSFIFMYLVLAAQFESWLHPITILLSLAADAPVRASSAHRLQAGARHLFDPRHPRALRRREEERHPPDRPHEPPARRRACRGSRPSSRPTATACGPS